jgi:hypothetical protein
MGRYIGLCLILLSFFYVPGNASALDIKGEVWQNALASAMNPIGGPPSATPDATFLVTDLNFDSRLIQNVEERKNITFDQFLNSPANWNNSTNPILGLTPQSSMFTGTDQGVFFRFSWTMHFPGGSVPLIVTHDDGFFLRLIDVFKYNASDTVGKDGPAVTKFDLTGIDEGDYRVILEYGAMNDTTTQVLIVRTPEPGTVLLLGLGLVAVGVVILMRRRRP